MKKIYLLTLSILAICPLRMSGQGIFIHHTDGSVSTFNTAEVEQITTGEQIDSYILGTWYLNQKISNAGTNTQTITNVFGTESITFAGTELITNSQGKKESSELKFYSNKRYRVKPPVGFAVYYDVVRQTDNQLVVKDGNSITYYYYSSPLEAAMPQPTRNELTSASSIVRTYGTGKSASTKTPMGKHFENRHVTTDNDRTWLANPNNEPHKIANLTQWVTKTVRLYPYGDPVPADVNQHAIGDCCFCAVLASLAYLYPDFIKSIITDNGNGSYTVAMYDPQGLTVDVCVSNKFLCDGNGNIGQMTGKNNVADWATVLEKALIKWQYIYEVDKGIEGIGTENSIPPFTGNGDSFAFSPGSLFTNELKLAIEYCLDEGKICVGGFNKGDLYCGALTTVTGHAFTFMRSPSPCSIFGMRNPWGNDNNGKQDGLLEIPDNRVVVATIDARIVDPGAAAPYLREDLKPYSPPSYVRKATDLGVAPRLLNRRIEHPNDSTELW